MFFKKKPKAEDAVDPALKRAHYRKPNSKSQSLEASLRVAGWEPVRVELIDLSVQGAGVRVPFSKDRNRKAGDAVVVTIGTMMREDVVINARVANVNPDGKTHIRYGLAFTNLGELYSQLDGFYARHFNRRKHVRVIPGLDRRIHATLRWGEQELRVPVFDISEDGLGVTLSKDSAALIADVSKVEVAFKLPGAAEEIRGKATIRHRTANSDKFHVGLQLDTSEAGGFGPHVTAIRAFVEMRKAEIALWEKTWG
jgi:c-di-GMP-binding flagellar brake protein YcgR